MPADRGRRDRQLGREVFHSHLSLLDHQVQDPVTSSLHTPSLRGFAGFFYFVVAKVLYSVYLPTGTIAATVISLIAVGYM